MGVRVSVVIPVWNGEAFVARAVHSALAQTLTEIEVLVADNGSTDGTWKVLERLAAEDRRVRPLRALGGQGPDVARNACLDVAQGEWIAVLDADDVMHLTRLERLLGLAEANGAKLVADNQRLVEPAGRILRLAWPSEKLPSRVDAAAFVRANIFGQRMMPLGYVKPVFHRSLIEKSGLRYAPRPRVVEDYHFLYALLRQGAVLNLLPEALYDYVQMPSSLSRSFGVEELSDIRVATEAHFADAGDDQALGSALLERLRSVDAALAHCAFVSAMKQRRPGRALAVLLERPAAIPLVLRYGGESVAKRLKRRRSGARPIPPAAVVGYFGQDCTDSAVIRRIAAFQAAGAQVLGFTFRREKFNRSYRPAWDNLPLGVTCDRNYRGRLGKLIRAAWVLLANRRRLAGISMFYARNIDMALLAWFARLVSRSAAPLVYEVLDVQRAFLGPSPSARLLRWVERRVLARCRLLVVSSPGFVCHYFQPAQRYRGDWFLLENKILGPQLRAMQVPQADVLARVAALRGGRWVIGWFGTLRCVESLRMLAAIAEALPDKVLIYLRGFPTETGLEPFLAVVGRYPNMVYEGEFFSPRDLPTLYSAVDFAWGFDFLDAGGNSDWLLPNRLYDAGYFSVPVLAAARTQTGAHVTNLGLGWTFEAPHAPAVAEFLRRVTAEEVAACRDRIATLPRSLFCEEDDTRRLMNTVLAARLQPALEVPAQASGTASSIS